MAAPHSPPEKLVCPSCRNTLDGAPSRCPACGDDLRGLGATNDTLAGTQRPGPLPPQTLQTGPVPGAIIDRRYRIQEKLGEGGMGAVYRVEHVRMGKLMALKLLRPESALDRNAIKRFQQEARIVSKLSHPNTVSVFDFGELDDGTLFMAMEYVPGRDLSRQLEAEGAFSEKRAVSIIMQVLRSLAEAHDAGIVHRDVKPANVMLLRTREGEDFVKLLDFGIAKLAEAARAGADKRATGQGDFVGTPLYMSPEQVAGETIDHRSDLYSVGVMLHELLTGQPLFDGPTAMAVAAKHLNEKPRRAHEVAPHLAISEAVEAVLARALVKDPRDRWASADEMRAALAGTRDHVSMPAITTGDWSRLVPAGQSIARRDDWDEFEKSLRRGRWLAPCAALVLLGGAAAGGAYWYRQRQPPPVVRVPVGAEVEPNDGPRTANLIEPGREVTGLIQRVSRDKADADLFEFHVPGPDPLQATVAVSGVPNVNLSLDLFRLGEGASDERLPNLAHADDLFLGGEERLTDLKLAPGRYLLRLADRRRPDEGQGAPRENTLDPYILKVDLAPLPRFFEEEPDNVMEQAMRLAVSRPVFGHPGSRAEASQVKTATGETAEKTGLFSDDFYEVVLSPGATQVCVLLSGVRGATLSLSTVATDRARLAAGPDPQGALREHLAKQAREKPVRVAAGEVEKRCARAAETAMFKVQVAEGRSADRYVLVAVDDSDDGFVGVLAACEQLQKEGDVAGCRQLLTKAIAALPVSKSVDEAKKLLSSLP